MKEISDKSIGTILAPNEYNSLQEENENIVTSSGLILDSSGAGTPDPDPTQISQATARYSSGGGYFYTCSGTTPLYELTSKPGFHNVNSYFDGMIVAFQATFDNGASPQINVNGFGAKDLKRYDGTDIPAGTIRTSEFVDAVYFSSTDNFRLKFFVPQLLVDKVSFAHETSQGGMGGAIDELIIAENYRKRRPITDINYNGIGPDFDISLAENKFRPAQGTYKFKIYQNFAQIQVVRSWLRRHSDNAVIWAASGGGSEQQIPAPGTYGDLMQVFTVMEHDFMYFDGVEYYTIECWARMTTTPQSPNLGRPGSQPPGGGLPTVANEFHMQAFFERLSTGNIVPT
jgi:hypothetical protein